jgi:phage baseplate assembly protein W
MLYVTQITDGVDTGTVITSVDMVAQDTEKGAYVQVAAVVHEDDTALPQRNVSASLDWNDGSAAVSFPKTAGGSLTVDVTKFLAPGTYVVRLRAQNYRTPVENVSSVNFFVVVTSPIPVQKPQNILFGPILPRDTGFPNSSQWEFNTNYDMYILESSVKMLLLTAKGDRIMEPDYGTNIRRLIFDSQLDGIESLIQEEVVTAFAVWEPRVALRGITVQADSNNRSVSLNLSLVSRLSTQPFNTSVAFVK